MAHATRKFSKLKNNIQQWQSQNPILCLFDPAKALSRAVPGRGLDTVFGAAEHDNRSIKVETVEFETRGRHYCLSGGNLLPA